MTPFFIGLTTGIFLGAILGFTICALMVTAKRADRKAGVVENETD